eukprot:4012582-Amphidinium_carterae.2
MGQQSQPRDMAHTHVDYHEMFVVPSTGGVCEQTAAVEIFKELQMADRLSCHLHCTLCCTQFHQP